MSPASTDEFGSRVMRALQEENHGVPKYRMLAIILRYYSMFKRGEGV